MSSINWTSLISQYHCVEHGQKGAFFDWLDSEYGISKDKFHRERRKREGKMKTVEREKDQRKRVLVKHVLQMKERGKMRSDDPREMATERCLNRLVRKGIMDEGELSAAHANYIARTEFGYREATPRVRWEADYALQEVQADGSTSKFFRPVKHVTNAQGQSDVLLKASHRPLSYRQNEDRERVILWQFLDKYSRLRTVRAFPAKAESTLIMAAHMKFWLNREDDEHPMRHLPWQLAHDNASLFGHEYQALRKALEFDDRTSTPYEKTGIGSVENRWKVIWQWELEWSEDYDTILLSEYNMLLHEAMIAEQYEEHPYYNGLKGDLYQQSILKQDPRPRMVDVDIMSLIHKTYERKVNKELTVSTPETGKLRVPQHWYGIEMIGQEVRVFMNYRGDYKAELVNVPDFAVDEAREPFALQEFTHRSIGDFSGSHSLTYQQRLKEQIKNGDGLYEAIMAGEVALDDEGLPFDTETGEYIEAPKPVKLQPAKEVHQPESPFTEPDKKDLPERFASSYQARVWIGQQLKELGIEYAQVDSYFGPRLVQEFYLKRDVIAEAVERLKQNLNKQAVNH